MVNLRWNNGLSVGKDRIDRAHQVYFDLINETSAFIVNGADTKSCLRHFQEFAQSVRFHFVAEESLMLKTCYEEFDEHRALHAHCVDTIKTKLAGYENGKITANDFLDFMSNWFLLHISKEDIKLAIHLNSQQLIAA